MTSVSDSSFFADFFCYPTGKINNIPKFVEILMHKLQISETEKFNKHLMIAFLLPHNPSPGVPVHGVIYEGNVHAKKQIATLYLKPIEFF